MKACSGGVLRNFLRLVLCYLFGTFAVVAFVLIIPELLFHQKQTLPTQSHSLGSSNDGPSSLLSSPSEIFDGTGIRTVRTSKVPLIIIPNPVPAEGLEEIRVYHESEKINCAKMIIAIHPSKIDTDWCPCLPPDLKGRVIVNMVDNSDWTDISRSVGSDVLMGGEWSPAGLCVPHTRLAIIIPCRDRDSHLSILLRHIYPILKRQLTHFRIFVVDQRSPAVFNKAAIMNVAFLEAFKRFPFDCVVFHDVDLLLEDDRMLINCGLQPRHFAQALDKFGYGSYPTFGGAVSLTPEMFRRVDGFALRYFGWGGEDDDMWGRLSRFWQIEHPPWYVGRFSSIGHNEDSANPRTGLRRGTKIPWEISDGLRNVTYDLQDVQLKPLFTRFHVDLNITFLPYPDVPEYTYQKVPGFCTDPDVVMATKSVSIESCRSQCDILLWPRCFGFSYAKRPHGGGVDGSKLTTNGRCSLLRSLCDLSRGKRTGMTFVKDIRRGIEETI